MASATKICIAALVPGIAVVLFLALQHRRESPTPIVTEPTVAVPVPVDETKTPGALGQETSTNKGRIRPQSGVRRRFVDFTDAEKAQFLTDYNKRFRPAIAKWCKTYDGRVPFSAEDVTPEKLAERFSKNTSLFAEYAFVVDGITLGIRDVNGSASVDYLNDPKQTKKMATLPSRLGAPTIDLPLTRDEVANLLKNETGTTFAPREIRMKPSGFSGGLDGGVLVHVGGDPANGASWKYDIVFGPDGKLAFYLKGQGQQ